MSSAVHKQAADTPAESQNGSESSDLSSSNSTENNGISSTNGTSTSSAASSSVSSTSLESSSSGVSSSSSSLSNNPFVSSTAKLSSTAAASSPTTSISSTRPVLAPSKLGGFGCSVTSARASSSKGTVSSSVLAPSRLFGASGGATSFGASSRSSEQLSGAKFKLKPSILGSSVSSNPFLKAPPTDSEVSSNSTKDGSDAADSSPSGSTSKEGPSSSSTEGVDSSSEGSKGASPVLPSGSSSKASVDQISCSSSTEKSSGTSSSSNKSLFGNFSPQRPDKPKSQSPQQSGLTTSNGVASSSLFKHSTASPASSSFIFGQNLQSRVATAPLLPSPPAPSSSGANNGSGEENGPASSDNLFTAAASEFATSSCSSTSQSVNGASEVKSLATSSRELAEKESSQKRKFDQIEVITGEETESNVLQMNCKVYTWLKGGWVERGRGILRLNDWGSGGVEMRSRLVIRTQGTLTIMLNTKIWKEMAVEKPSEKGVKFTALDPDGQLKLYLIMGGTKDIELLFTSLECRVANSRRRELEASSSKKSRSED